MIAWYVVELVRNGKPPVGASRWNATVNLSTFRTPPGERTPLYAESACEPPFGSVSRLYVATTSSAVISCPVWNLTPRRSLYVQTSAFLFDFQLVASSGMSLPLSVVRLSISPAMLPVTRLPVSAYVCGSRPCAGGGMQPTRRRPPTCPRRVPPNASGASPAAARAAAMAEVER